MGFEHLVTDRAAQELGLSSSAWKIWDRRDARGCMGAPATVVVPWFADRCDDGASNQEVAGSRVLVLVATAGLIGWLFLDQRGEVLKPGGGPVLSLTYATGLRSQTAAAYITPQTHRASCAAARLGVRGRSPCAGTSGRTGR
jgi:hypothetical protein